MKEIIKEPNIAVIKDSCADFQQIQRELSEIKDKDIAFFNGAEELVGAVSLFGANGSIPGLAKETLSYPFSNLNVEEKAKIREIIQEVTK